MNIENFTNMFDERGSVTVESAIIFPVIIAVLMFGYTCLAFCVNYFMISYSFHKTSEQLCDYAYIYHEKFISQFSENAKDSIKSEFDKQLDKLLAEIPTFISDIVDVKGYASKYGDDLLDNAADQIYLPIAHTLFNSNLEKSELPYKISEIDFSRSDFFHDDNTIVLKMNCNMEFPLPFLPNDGVSMDFTIKSNAWTNGIGKSKEVTTDIWSLDNFSRGTRIREMYGGNLPHNFPVISSFKDGRATIIKSFDFRKESYKAEGAMSSKVGLMVAEIANYQGQVKPFGEGKITIQPNEIKERELILVIPDGECPENINTEINKIKANAERYGVILRIERL